MPKLTPTSREFLRQAVACGGDVVRTNRHASADVLLVHNSTTAKHLRLDLGERLLALGLLERVKAPGSANTSRLGTGYHYRVTDAGRAVVASISK